MRKKGKTSPGKSCPRILIVYSVLFNMIKRLENQQKTLYVRIKPEVFPDYWGGGGGGRS